MEHDYRIPSPEVIAVKVSRELALAIRKQAREDDRTVSGYLRLLLQAAVQGNEKRRG